jgi:hypothetical protein
MSMDTDRLVRMSRGPQLPWGTLRLTGMKKLALLVSVLVAGLGVFAAVAAAKVRGIAGGRCPAKTSRVITADSQAQLYLALEPPEKSSMVVFGCAFRSKRTYVLGEPFPRVGSSSGVDGIALETLSGDMVAYELAYGGQNASSWVVDVFDLRTGRLVYNVPTGEPKTPLTGELGENGLPVTSRGTGPATAIVLKSDGSVAWIAENDALSTSGKYYEVHALDKSGSRVVAAGTDVEPESLALAGSMLYWTQNGVAASTILQ